MSEHVFYSTENRHNEREVTIVNIALLVGKPPTKEKRIRVKVRMILSGQSNTGAPDWLDAAHVFVAQWHDPVFPAVDFKGYDLAFSVNNLFDAEGAKAPRCQMRAFEIGEYGSSEQPDVAATFTIYAGFSTALWNWLGQYGGDSCWCAFTPGVAASAADSTDDEEDAEDDEEPTDTDEDDTEDFSDPVGAGILEMPGKKTGAELAEYNADMLQQEQSQQQKRGRGRPRKNNVDPLTVNTPVMVEHPF